MLLMRKIWAAGAVVLILALLMQIDGARGAPAPMHSADSILRGPCVAPVAVRADVLATVPDASEHSLDEAQRAALERTYGLVLGDAAVWFESATRSSVLVVVFWNGCRIGRGEFEGVLFREVLRAAAGRAT